MKSKTIRILHLSDLHLCPERRWDADPVLRGLTKALGCLVGDGLAPDIVAITGDIAAFGKKEDYDVASAFVNDDLLAVLPRFQTEHLLIVPGNHDVDRSGVSLTSRAVQQELLNGGQDAIAEVLASNDSHVLTRRHSEFLSFVNSFRGVPLEVPWWNKRLTIGSCEIGIAGLCSSWMCHKIDEQGDLLVGRYQLNQVLPLLEDCDIRIALVHHPKIYMREFDGEEIWSTLRNKCHLILRGHLHKQETEKRETPDDTCIEVAAGSLYAGSQYPNAFQLIEIDVAKWQVVIHYRTWRNGVWIPDRNAYQASSDGRASFSIGNGIAASPGISATVSTPERQNSSREEYCRRVKALYSGWDLRNAGTTGRGGPKQIDARLDEMYVPVRFALERGSFKALFTERGEDNTSEPEDLDTADPLDLENEFALELGSFAAGLSDQTPAIQDLLKEFHMALPDAAANEKSQAFRRRRIKIAMSMYKNFGNPSAPSRRLYWFSGTTSNRVFELATGWW